MDSRLVVLPALLLLTGCDLGEGATAQLLARQRALDPPSLWLIKDADARGRVLSARWTCADAAMGRTFARAKLEVQGSECRTVGAPVETSASVSLKCIADGRPYGFVTSVRGDLSRDFQMTVDVTPLDGSAGGAEETRAYHRQGPCPPSWRIGDQAPVS